MEVKPGPTQALGDEKMNGVEQPIRTPSWRDSVTSDERKNILLRLVSCSWFLNPLICMFLHLTFSEVANSLLTYQNRALPGPDILLHLFRFILLAE